MRLTARRQRDEDAHHAEWLARRQEINDSALRLRAIACVDRAISNAHPGQVDSDTTDGIELTSMWWRWKRGADVTAQKTVHPDGGDYQIAVEDRRDPDAGPWVVVTTRPDLDDSAVLWMPGRGFDTPAAFLDWFEEASR
jgi:hypothetical protein